MAPAMASGASPASRAPRTAASAAAGSRSPIASATTKPETRPCPSTTASTCSAVRTATPGCAAHTEPTWEAITTGSPPAWVRIAAIAVASALRLSRRNSSPTSRSQPRSSQSAGRLMSMRSPAAVASFAILWTLPVPRATRSRSASGDGAAR